MKRTTAFSLIILLVGGAYWWWLQPGFITFGDWGFLSMSRMQEYFPFPEIWGSSTGLGGFQNVALLSSLVYALVGLLAHYGVGFDWVERLVWYLPFVILTPLGIYVLLTELFKQRVVSTVGALFYSLNTYVLSMAGGGLLTIGVGIALAPLVIWLCIRAYQQQRWADRILAGLIIVAQMQYDSRVTYLTIGMFLSYVLFQFLFERQPSISSRLKSLGWLFAGAGGVVVVLNLYWIVPALLAGSVNPALPTLHLDADWIRKLSYITPSHALAVLHPFWGGGRFPTEVQSVQWYSYIWPIAAFSTLFLAKRDWRIVWLLWVALAGVFLVSGAQGPVTGGYEWLFGHLPGFEAFRDPSKHFIILVLAYSGLIGLTVDGARRWLAARTEPRIKRIAAVLPVGLFCLILVLSVKEVYLGQVGRSFDVRRVPVSYQQLTTFIDQDPQFFRTLWVPIPQRFAPTDNSHPAVGAVNLAQSEFKSLETDPKQVESWLYNPNAEYLLSGMAVKYVIVPEDSEGDIFRNYESRDVYIARLDALPYLTPVEGFGPIKVYRNKYYSDHIYPTTAIEYLSLAAARSESVPEFNRLSNFGKDPAQYPGLMIANSYDVISQDRFGGGQVLDIAAARQREGEMEVPFLVSVPGSYQLWAHRQGDQSNITSVRVVSASGLVFYQNSDVEPLTAENFLNAFTFSISDRNRLLSDQNNAVQRAGYVRLGTVELAPGSYRLVIEDDGLRGASPIRNGSFEDELPPGLAVSSDSTDRDKSLQLSGGRDLSDVPLQVEDFDSNITYRVTLDYKNVSGDGPYYGIEQVGVPSSQPPRPLPVSSDWRRFSTIVKPTPGSTGLRLHLYARGSDAYPAVNRFDNVRVAPVDTIDNLFVRSGEQSARPTVQFDRQSATRYVVGVTGATSPFYLTFAESYHPGWVLKVRDGDHLASLDARHVVMNGYANAWYLDRRGDYQLEIDFQPQQLMKIGMYFSVLGLVVTLLLLTVTLWRRW